MIGGGRGSRIGSVHRIAAAMDGQAELVAGAFSTDAERSRESGADLFLDPERVYPDYEDLVRAEAARPADERLDFVVIATPNHEHFRPAKLLLQAGFNVICDKPVTLTLAEARELQRLVRRRRKVFVLTHNYTGNIMVKHARFMVRQRELGKIRKVVVEYPQGWLSARLETTGHKQASWRTDPRRSGLGGCIADIGTHAENLARYVTGLRIDSLCADLSTFVKGRDTDDDGSILVRYRGGAKGVLFASQIANGDANALKLRVYGEFGSLEWFQEQPNELQLKVNNESVRTLRRGHTYLAPDLRRFTRVPAGHPEGFLEAFANLYLEAFRAIRAEVAGKTLPIDLDFPTIEDGVEGMAFIETAVQSSRSGAVWTKLSAV